MEIKEKQEVYELEALLPSHFKLENRLLSSRLQQRIRNCPGYKRRIKDGRFYDRRKMNHGPNPSPRGEGADPCFLLGVM